MMRRSLIAASFLLATLTACNGGMISLHCNHWGNIRKDIEAGTLTDSEIRTKITEVRNGTSDLAVKRAATRLLDGISSDSSYEMSEGAKALTTACK
jgi:hypothetical protein